MRGGDGAPRRSASGRIPRWATDEALGADHPPPGRPDLPPPVAAMPRRGTGGASGRRRRNRRPGSGAKTLMVLALVAFLFFGPGLLQRYVVPAIEPYLPGADVPPRGVEAAAEPLGRPPAVAPSSGFALQPVPGDSQPFAAYDPCRPVHYVIRPDNAPAGGERLIHEAVAEVSLATGLSFVHDGGTAEAFADDGREKFQPERYGKRWAPVLFAWSTPEEVPRLEGDTAGLGGSSFANAPGGPFVLVAGQVALDAPVMADMMGWPDGADAVRGVILHELGHVMGLDHVADPSQLMYVGPGGASSLADGDRAGLAILGTGECVPQL